MKVNDNRKKLTSNDLNLSDDEKKLADQHSVVDVMRRKEAGRRGGDLGFHPKRSS